MLVGYARISTNDQAPALQLDTLKQAGRDRVYTETASGQQRDRSELKAALGYMRAGDTLVVWRLDRLAPVREATRPWPNLRTIAGARREGQGRRVAAPP